MCSNRSVARRGDSIANSVAATAVVSVYRGTRPSRFHRSADPPLQDFYETGSIKSHSISTVATSTLPSSG